MHTDHPKLKKKFRTEKVQVSRHFQDNLQLLAPASITQTTPK